MPTAAAPTPVARARAVVAAGHRWPGPMAAVIERCRRELGLSQELLASRLAEVSGNPAVTREQVSRWERGKRIPGPYWRAWLSQVLVFPRDYLDEVARMTRVTRRKSAEVAAGSDRAADSPARDEQAARPAPPCFPR